MADDLTALVARIADLERILRTSHRMGTVKKTDKGMTQVAFGKGDGGDSDGDHTTPMIRTARSGMVSSDEPFTEGETVHVLYAGGNPEHAVVLPGGHSDHHPLDANVDGKKRVGRYRRPPEKSQQDSKAGGQGESSQYGDSENKSPKWKDSDDDLMFEDSHDRSWRKKGDAEYEITKDHAKLKHGKTEMIAKKGESTMMVDGVGVKIKDGKIYLIGEVLIGDEGASDKLATEKTLDSTGGKLMPPFSTKAKTL